MSRQRSVKRIFSFSSGTLNKLGIWGAVIDPRPRLAARAGGLALAAATGRLAEPRPRPPPLADAHVVRAARRLEGRQADVRQLALGRRPPGARPRARARFRFGSGLRLR